MDVLHYLKNRRVKTQNYSGFSSELQSNTYTTSVTSGTVGKDKGTEDSTLINIAYIENSPTVKQTNSYIYEAIKLGTSDIHFEPFHEYVIIRFRVDGILYEKYRINNSLYNSVATRVKVLSKMNIAERRVPQDGSFQMIYESKTYDFRVSTLPTVHGEKLVMRILYKNESTKGFDALSKIIDNDIDLGGMLKHNHGIILITGPTGSGKSTSLYTMINKLNTIEKNIITIEDPVEYEVYGINQVSVNLKSGVTFESGLRSILRQDPDIIMIGEIRDSITAEIAVRAAGTGHLVLSTLHTNDACSSISRLIDMGVPKYLIADSLIGVMAQRLVRVLCSECREVIIPENPYLRALSQNEKVKFYTKKGCRNCNHTGYLGRTIVYELLKLDMEIKKLICTNGDTETIKKLSSDKGMKSIEQHCLRLLKNGITSVEEYERVCYSMGYGTKGELYASL